MESTKKVLAIYANQDKEVVQDILSRLRPMAKDSNVSIWADDPIHSGQQWKLQKASRLNQADIFLLLVSNSFMYSQFIQQIEFKKIIDKYKAGKATVIPILLDDCPWDTEFNSDEYNFSFKELAVLPEDRKPISIWNSSDKPLKHVTDKLRTIIAPNSKIHNLEEFTTENRKEKLEDAKEEQIALNFNEETEAKSIAKAETKLKEERESQKQVAEEKKRKAAEVEVERAALEEKKRKAAEAEVEKAALEEKKLKEAAEAKRIAIEEKKLKEEAEAKRVALEEKKLRESEAKKRIEDEARQREKADRMESAPAYDENIDEPRKESNEKLKNRALIGIAAILAIFGIWFFSDSDKSSEKPEATLQKVEVTNEKDTKTLETPKVETVKQEAVSSKLAVGDFHKGGIIFSIDASGETGKIAHFEDAGPMSWRKANKIHEQAGDGWRLPTLKELRAMRKVIGQGANNDGEFSDGLYWSSTIYETYQARLLRFRDGNASYHYNKGIENRKFLVRAVKDF